MSKLRIRRLTTGELRQMNIDRENQLVLGLFKAGYDQPLYYGVLEETYGEGSAEGESWKPVEIY